MVLPDKWGNYSTPNYNTGKCATCGHDVIKHASNIGTCMAGTCSCTEFVQSEANLDPLEHVAHAPVVPKKKPHHDRRHGGDMMAYYACQICRANREI